jgi:hypothetical protein
MTSAKNGIETEVGIITHLIDENARKRYERKRRISIVKLTMNDGEMPGDFAKRIGAALESEHIRVTTAVSNIVSVRERMTSLAADLQVAGFKDAAKQMERMAKNVVPSNDIDDDDDDEIEM